MKRQSWFDVDREGLRELTAGKPKSLILRELIANAFDETITQCTVTGWWEKGLAYVHVADNCPEGFKRLSDAFTLFASTSKRSDVTKRGRFNFGEKQVLAMAESAIISTTKGTVEFSKTGRRETRLHLETGSQIRLVVRMTHAEYEEMMASVERYIVPHCLILEVNGKPIRRPVPWKGDLVVDDLPTELLKEGQFRRTTRRARIDIYPAPAGGGFLYEMGIPVQPLTCPWLVDVQQKIPLSTDRETVPDSYLTRIYAEVLNVTATTIAAEAVSEPWIRDAMSTDAISPETVKTIVEQRYGKKVAIAGFDRRSTDDAIAHGYQIVHGSQMSKGEWENIRAAGAMTSADKLFPKNAVPSKPVEISAGMRRVERLTKKIAKLYLGIDVTVDFVTFQGVSAQYGGRHLTFNVGSLGRGFFEIELPTNDAVVPGWRDRFAKCLDLIVHELSHETGGHTDHAYHETITRLAGELTARAISDPSFFTRLEGF